MSLKDQRYLGKFKKPQGRAYRVYAGIDSDTGKTVRFTNPNGSPQPIPAEEWTKWRKVCD